MLQVVILNGSNDFVMSSPKLIVIIPTLKRPDTLYWTLRTVLNQQYNNYSIIVSDNCSNDNTADVVASFNSDKITYIQPAKKLSMSHHWEFALEYVDDGYVTILGDDDGMLPGGLQKVAALIQKHKVPAVGWRFGNFNWKGLPPYFMIPMANYYRVIDAPTEIKKIFAQSIYRTIQFPSLYGGFIHIDLIKELKKRHGGVFFHSRIPDFFSGALVAASIKNYIRAEFPITINATSRHSAGFATINAKNDQTAFIDLQKQEGNIPFHKDLTFIRSNAIPIAEAMLQVHELVPSFPKVNIEKVLKEVIEEAVTTPTEEKFDGLLEGVRQITEMNNLNNPTSDFLKNIVQKPQPETVKKKFSPVSFSLYIDTTETTINNIEDACNFTSSIVPSDFIELKSKLFKNYLRFSALTRYLYFKYISDKRIYL